MLLSLEDEEAKTEMDALIQSLEERRRHESYGKIRQAAKRLEPLEEFGRCTEYGIERIGGKSPAGVR